MLWYEELTMSLLGSRFVPKPLAIVGGLSLCVTVAVRETVQDGISMGLSSFGDYCRNKVQAGLNPLDVSHDFKQATPQHPSMDLMLDNPQLCEEPEDCLEVLVANEQVTKKRVNRHARGTFAAHAAMACKLHFGLVPMNTRANLSVATRFITNYCQERHVVPTHTRAVVDAAIPLVFTPDSGEIGILVALNHRESQIRRLAAREATIQQTPLAELVTAPWCGASWVRVARVLSGYEDFTTFHFSN
ncbi:replicase (p26) [Japanese iris necrotic ring virus]|nr:replicase (p26) [Japanese iris necrotic ring virus]BAA92793.1 replicase (p26) [Japanese iris necrotic ring virus]